MEMQAVLIIGTAALCALSLAAARKSGGNREGFYLGLSAEGAPPSLLTLVLSQVTTWIFARSLLNAAILRLLLRRLGHPRLFGVLSFVFHRRKKLWTV